MPYRFAVIRVNGKGLANWPFDSKSIAQYKTRAVDERAVNAFDCMRVTPICTNGSFASGFAL